MMIALSKPTYREAAIELAKLAMAHNVEVLRATLSFLEDPLDEVSDNQPQQTAKPHYDPSEVGFSSGREVTQPAAGDIDPASVASLHSGRIISTDPDEPYNKWVEAVRKLLKQAHGPLWANDTMREQNPGHWIGVWKAGKTPEQAALPFLKPPTGRLTDPEPPEPPDVVAVGDYIEQVKTVLRHQFGWGDSYINARDWSVAPFAQMMLDGLTIQQAASKVGGH